ncbi:aspartate transaminase aat1 [Bonamia ostreae]|uniref:Aspartate transaminase aat1 n=1 Tax=Bonamia ostreae TaxID=126728 RepID=A0ABV2AUJ6_9EUKA
MIFHKLNKPFVSRTKAVMSTSQLLKNNKKEFIKSTRNLSTFGGIEEGKKDAIFGLHEQFERDSDVKKVDLTIGSYKDDNGESYVFPSVKAAEISIVDKNLKMDYLPISGNRGFLKHALYLMYGKDNNVLMENRVAAIQSLSG